MPTTLAFIGAGNIAGPYAESIARHEELDLAGVYDVDSAKAAEFAESHAIAHYATIDALEDADIDIVVNLTSAPFHYDVTKQLIERGQSVFSEKPLALTSEQARELVILAAEKGVRLGCAPSLWLGTSAQDAAALVRQGDIGTVRYVTADVNHGRIESWHPAPENFYRVGPVVDVGVYPLAYTTAVLGPIRSVSATATIALPQRVALSGASFEVSTADAWVIAAEFESGALLRLTCNFYVASATEPRRVDFHGDRGSIRTKDFFSPAAGVDRADYGSAYEPLIPAADTPQDWALGVAEMAAALEDGRPHRASAEHAAHVVEVLEAIATSAAEGRRVAVGSSFPDPGASV